MQATPKKGSAVRGCRLRLRCSDGVVNVLKVLDDQTEDGSVAEHATVGDGREDVEGGIGKDGALAGHDVGVDAGANAAGANVVREGRPGEVAQELAAGSHFASALAPGEPGDPRTAMWGCEEDGAADRWHGSGIVHVAVNKIVSKRKSTHGMCDDIDVLRARSFTQAQNCSANLMGVIEVAAERIIEFERQDCIRWPAVCFESARDSAQGSGTVLPPGKNQDGHDGTGGLAQRGDGMRSREVPTRGALRSCGSDKRRYGAGAVQSMMKVALLCEALLVAGACSSEAAGPDTGFLRTARGIEYRAWTEILESFPVQLRTKVRITNATNSAIDITFPDGCVVLVRAYPGNASAPAWDQQFNTGCTTALVPLHLEPGKSATYVSASGARAILGDSLPDGRYRLLAYLRPYTGPVTVEAGSADLSVPRS